MTKAAFESYKEQIKSLGDHLRSKPGGATEEDLEALRYLISLHRSQAQELEDELTRRGMLAPVNVHPDKPAN